MQTGSQANIDSFSKELLTMAKLSKEQIAARRKSMQEEALKSVTKSEQLNLRVDGDSIERLYAMAGRQGKPVGTMVREWILERLCSEEIPSQTDPMVEIEKLKESLTSLHAKVDGLSFVAMKDQAEKEGVYASRTVREKAEREYLKVV
jgi:hypothetical protein